MLIHSLITFLICALPPIGQKCVRKIRRVASGPACVWAACVDNIMRLEMRAFFAKIIGKRSSKGMIAPVRWSPLNLPFATITSLCNWGLNFTIFDSRSIAIPFDSWLYSSLNDAFCMLKI